MEPVKATEAQLKHMQMWVDEKLPLKPKEGRDGISLLLAHIAALESELELAKANEELADSHAERWQAEATKHQADAESRRRENTHLYNVVGEFRWALQQICGRDVASGIPSFTPVEIAAAALDKFKTKAGE